MCLKVSKVAIRGSVLQGVQVAGWRRGKAGGMVLALGAKPNLGPEEAATPKPAEENRKQTSSKLELLFSKRKTHS